MTATVVADISKNIINLIQYRFVVTVNHTQIIFWCAFKTELGPNIDQSENKVNVRAYIWRGLYASTN